MTHEEILQKALRKYKPGMIVDCVYGNQSQYTIDGIPFMYKEGDGQNRIIVKALEKTDTRDNTFAVHGNGRWSNIIKGKEIIKEIINTYEIY